MVARTITVFSFNSDSDKKLFQSLLIANSDKISGGANPKESKYSSFVCEIQCVHICGRSLTNPSSVVNILSVMFMFVYMPKIFLTSFVFVFNVAPFCKLKLLTK